MAIGIDGTEIPTTEVTSVTPEISAEARESGSDEFDAARFLLEKGFYPMEAVGIVRHISTPHQPGRTLGSVWKAMCTLLESRRS